MKERRLHQIKHWLSWGLISRDEAYRLARAEAEKKYASRIDKLLTEAR